MATSGRRTGGLRDPGACATSCAWSRPGSRPPGRPVLVVVDGADGTGKTVFADDLAPLLPRAVRASVDDFHHPRSHRHALGRTGETVWERSFDYVAVRRELLDPWRRGAGAVARAAPPRVEQLTTYGDVVEAALPDGLAGATERMPVGPRVVEVVDARPHRTGQQRSEVVGEDGLAGAVGTVDGDQDRPAERPDPESDHAQDPRALRGYEASSSSPRRRHWSSSQTLALPSQPAASCHQPTERVLGLAERLGETVFAASWAASLILASSSVSRVGTRRRGSRCTRRCRPTCAARSPSTPASVAPPLEPAVLLEHRVAKVRVVVLRSLLEEGRLVEVLEATAAGQLHQSAGCCSPGPASRAALPGRRRAPTCVATPSGRPV